jgi:DNA transformation protein
MKPFRPSAQQTLKSDYEVPIDLIEDPEELVVWRGAQSNAKWGKAPPKKKEREEHEERPRVGKWQAPG